MAFSDFITHTLVTEAQQNYHYNALFGIFTEFLLPYQFVQNADNLR